MKLSKAKPGRKLVFNIGDVMQFLRTPPVRHGTNSVSSPSGEIATMLPEGFTIDDMTRAIMNGLETLKSYDLNVWRIALLQFENSLRISEVLQISPADIDSLGNVKINTLKGGQMRSVSTGELRSFFLECRQNSVYPFQGISRNYVYRCYTKCGLMHVTAENRNNIVTHLFRHVAAAAIRKEGFDPSIISQKLAHKSKNTEKHYGQDFTEKEESA